MSIAQGMQLSRQWDAQFAQMGSAPGLNEGDVVIELDHEVSGMASVRVDSSKLTLAAEGGGVIGLFIVLDAGHRLFLPWGNVTGIYDAPDESRA